MHQMYSDISSIGSPIDQRPLQSAELAELG
jgi:hypothetical protein